MTDSQAIEMKEAAKEHGFERGIAMVCKWIRTNTLQNPGFSSPPGSWARVSTGIPLVLRTNLSVTDCRFPIC